MYLGRQVLAQTSSGSGSQYLHKDVLGSAVARTGSGGEWVGGRTRWEPYGGHSGAAPGRLGFTGHVEDADTLLTYMQQRYYDPIAGRFLSVDPIVTDADTGDGFGRYHYAENNPYTYTDPTGMEPEAEKKKLPPVEVTGTRKPEPEPQPAGSVTMSIPMERPMLRPIPIPYAAPNPIAIFVLGVLFPSPLGNGELTDQDRENSRLLAEKADKGEKSQDAPKGGHSKGARNSTKGKQEKGDERRKRDQRGEKKDEQMRY